MMLAPGGVRCENHVFIIKNEKSCIRIARKRQIVYQNHTKTRNFVFKMMKFADAAAEGWEIEKAAAEGWEIEKAAEALRISDYLAAFLSRFHQKQVHLGRILLTRGHSCEIGSGTGCGTGCGDPITDGRCT